MFQDLFRAMQDSNFMPHGFCMKWDPTLVSTMIVANMLIALAYFAIPCALIYFVKKRKDLAFSWMFILFGIFIVSCGTTHLIKIWTIYKAAYWPEAIVDLFTGIVSMLTAILLWPLIPKALSLPSPAQLEESNKQLTKSMEETKQLNLELTLVNDELRQARDQAIEASNMKSAFVASISHELRTPLTGIIGMNELLQYSRLDEEQKMLAENVQSAASSLLTVVNDILDLSKLEAGKLEIELLPFSILEMLKGSTSVLVGHANEKNLLLKINIGEGLDGTVYGDSVRIKQILTNLLSNAIKFTEEGVIELKAKLLSRDHSGFIVRMSVSDTGIGIPAKEISKIFQPFTQADQTSQRRYGGTGLGLAISNYLANLMGTRIEVESQVGRGSKFWLDIRLEETCMAGTIQQSVQHGIPDFPDAMVLVVDDDPFLQKLARKQLEKLELKVTVAGGAYEALQLLQSTKFDLVLMDCHMPGMDGFSLTKKLREQERFRDLPIIAVTAGAMKGDYERCLAAGMNDYLSKPYTLKQLSDVLCKWLPQMRDLEQAGTEETKNVKSDGLVDLRKLQSAYGEDGCLEIVQTFFNTSKGIMEQLNDARAQNDSQQVKFFAHRLKGASAMACIEQVSLTCAAIEENASKEQWDEIDRLLSELELLLQSAKDSAEQMVVQTE